MYKIRPLCWITGCVRFPCVYFSTFVPIPPRTDIFSLYYKNAAKSSNLPFGPLDQVVRLFITPPVSYFSYSRWRSIQPVFSFNPVSFLFCVYYTIDKLCNIHIYGITCTFYLGLFRNITHLHDIKIDEFCSLCAELI